MGQLPNSHNRMRLKDDEVALIQKYRNKNGAKRYLAIGCIHIPFHNTFVLNGIIEMMKIEKFDGIIWGGDFLDMGALSSYEKGKINKSNVSLSDEYFAGNGVLDIFDSLLSKDAEKYFLFGNHESRYHKWLSDVNNNKYGDLINPIDALRLKDRGYEVYSDYMNDVLELGSLHIMHGFYYNIHCAKKHMDVFRRNVLFFHTHRVQMFREGDFCGYNAGCLANISSPAFNYATKGMKSAWANAFAVVTIDGDRHFVNTVNCVDNKFEFGGRIYGG